MRKLVSILAFLLAVCLLCPALGEELPEWRQRAAQTVFDFPGLFLEEGEDPIITDSSYLSENVSIAITEHRVNRCDVYVADVYIRSLDCLRHSLGDGFNKSCISVKNHLKEDGKGILALTGDSAAKITAGPVFWNGEAVRLDSNRKRDVCLIGWDGVMTCYSPKGYDIEDWKKDPPDVYQGFLFGPDLLDEKGHAKKKFNTTLEEANPRAVIGYYEPGHYCLVQVDGRSSKSVLEPGKYNHGMTMQQLSEFMESLGCAVAYNLDGGKSAVMVLEGEFVNTPINGGRRVYDAVIIGEP